MTFQGSWTYSGDPATSDLDAVRFLIGDTNEDDKQFSNEELAYLLSNNSSPYRAASAAATELGRRFASLATRKWVGDLHIEYLDRSAAYKELAKSLLRSGGSALPIAYAGGISVSDVESVRDDDDRVRPSFDKGLHDFPDVNSVAEQRA